MTIGGVARKFNVESNVVRDILIKNGIKTKRKTKYKIKNIIKYDLDGNFIKSYKIDDLCKELHKKKHSVYSYIKTSEACWGFKWKIEYN